jgi:hypothetical protein
LPSAQSALLWQHQLQKAIGEFPNCEVAVGPVPLYSPIQRAKKEQAKESNVAWDEAAGRQLVQRQRYAIFVFVTERDDFLSGLWR